ncbi:hypothetical protein CUB89_02950 [Akkermansia muciniphila]|nr:hypothetical protein CUB89_02950 [Akkermansia muciniphila]
MYTKNYDKFLLLGFQGQHQILIEESKMEKNFHCFAPVAKIDFPFGKRNLLRMFFILIIHLQKIYFLLIMMNGF